MPLNDTTPTTKTCSKCGESKPATAEYFSVDKRKLSGLGAECRVCSRKRIAKWKSDNIEHVKDVNRAYREENREIVNERTRAWAERNKERIAKRMREWHMRTRDRRREVSRAWKSQNMQRVLERQRERRAANPEREREQRRAYYILEPERHRAKSHRRRTRELQAEGSFTAEDIQRQYAAQKGRCYYAACGHSKLVKYEIDHIIPLSRGGTNWPDNLVLTCPSCNKTKNARLPSEWPEGGRLL